MSDAPKPNSLYARKDDDWYCEMPSATTALLQVEFFFGTVWDPCAGGGHIPDAVERATGLHCIASDIVDRGIRPGVHQLDFLTEWNTFRADVICMNSPYDQAQLFIQTALDTQAWKVCALVRSAFLEGKKRRRWFESTPLARIWQFSSRQSMPPGRLYHAGEIKAKGGAVAYSWLVWERGWRGPPQFGWLP
jgi:hypothetical protein